MPAKNEKKNEELLPRGAKKRTQKKKQEETVVQSKSAGEAVMKMGKGIVGVLGKARQAMEDYNNWVQKKNREFAEKQAKALQAQKSQAGQTGPTKVDDGKNLRLFQGAVRYPGLGQAARPGNLNIPEPPPTSIWDLARDAQGKAGKKEKEKD